MPTSWTKKVKEKEKEKKQKKEKELINCLYQSQLDSQKIHILQSKWYNWASLLHVQFVLQEESD